MKTIKEEDFVHLPEQERLPGCILILDLTMLTITVSYPDMRVFTISMAELLKSLPKP